jgi:hypothetical protein
VPVLSCCHPRESCFHDSKHTLLLSPRTLPTSLLSSSADLLSPRPLRKERDGRGPSYSNASLICFPPMNICHRGPEGRSEQFYFCYRPVALTAHLRSSYLNLLSCYRYTAGASCGSAAAQPQATVKICSHPCCCRTAEVRASGSIDFAVPLSVLPHHESSSSHSNLHSP